MQAALKSILQTDGRRLIRDRFLVGTVLYVLTISIAMRWLIPYATQELAHRADFDLVPYYPLVTSHILMQLAPLIGGLVGGFLLLESKEHGVIQAVRITPVSVETHIFVLGSLLVLGSGLIIIIEGMLIGVGVPSVFVLGVTAIAAAPAAIALALFVGAVSQTKTEAFAYTKIVAALPVVPTASWFLPEPLQYVVGLYPPYWASKAYWLAMEGQPSWLGFAAVGMGLSAAWTWIMLRFFIRRLRA